MGTTASGCSAMPQPAVWLLRESGEVTEFCLKLVTAREFTPWGGESQAGNGAGDPEGYGSEADRSEGHSPFKSLDHLWTQL